MTIENSDDGLEDEDAFEERVASFEKFIESVTFRDIEASPEERRQLMTEQLTFQDFSNRLRKLFTQDFKTVNLKNLYRKITSNPDASIDWTEVFGYQLKEKSENKKDESSAMPSDENTVFMLSRREMVGEATGNLRKRDSVRFLKYYSSLDTVLCVTEKGAVTIWNGQMKLMATHEIEEPFWCTCIEYLQNLRRIIVATERSFHIFDHRAQDKNNQMFAIKPMSQSPLCMAWVPLHSKPIGQDTVLFGDTQGNMNLLTVSVNDLVPKQKKDDKGRSVQSLVIDPKKLETSIVSRKLSDDWISRVTYYPQLKCFACCSQSTNFSFYLEPPERIKDNLEVHPVSVYKGVNAFGFCTRANVIVTGGVDKIIRVWHPHIWKRPNGRLAGHMFTICDIAINEKDQQVISLSTARIFRVWDIQMLACLQVFTDNEDRPGERRIYSISYDSRHERLITGASTLDIWPLTRTVQALLQVPQTHDKPLVSIVYNPVTQQVATVCTESIIKVWEADTGRFVYSLTDPHGEGVEITCLSKDPSGYKMGTGGNDGSIYIWDFGSGQELKYKQGSQTDNDFTIIGLSFCILAEENKKVVAAFGWTNKFRLLLESTVSRELMVWKEFNDFYTQMLKQISNISSSNSEENKTNLEEETIVEHLLETHDITCMCSYKSDFILTGCTNGNIIKWDAQTATVTHIFVLPESKYPPGHIALQGKTAFNIVSVKVMEHRRRFLDPVYLKKISKRNGNRTNTESTLISEEPEHENEEDDLEDKSGSINQEDSKEKVDEEDEEVGEDEDLDNPDKHILTESFPPLIVSAHHDGLVRFWSLEGELLKALLPDTKNEAALTAIGSDTDCNYLLTADSKGYVTQIEVADFLKNQGKDPNSGINQLVFWKAHTAKIVSIDFVEDTNVFLTASVDFSVRVWWGLKGRYVGYIGQPRDLRVPINEDTAGQQFLPYDITEWPQVPQRSSSAKQTERVTRNVKYPLRFHESLWDPFSRTQFINDLKKPKQTREPLDQKFFKAVIKQPHQDLKGSITGKAQSGFVFGSLPIYTVGNTDHVMELPKDLNVNTTFGKYNNQSAGRSKTTSREMSANLSSN